MNYVLTTRQKVLVAQTSQASKTRVHPCPHGASGSTQIFSVKPRSESSSRGAEGVEREPTFKGLLQEAMTRLSDRLMECVIEGNAKYLFSPRHFDLYPLNKIAQ